MKPKQILVLGGIAVVVGVIAVMSSRKDTGTRLAAVAAPVQETTFFRGVDPEAIHQIHIESGQGRVVLTRLDERRWTMETPRGPRRVSQSKVENLFQRGGFEAEIRRDMRGRQVAESRASHARLGVVDGVAPKVRFLDANGRELEHLVFGARSEQAISSSFVRRPREEAVFIVSADLSDNYTGGPREWRERRFLPDARHDNIVRLRYDDVVTTRSYELRAPRDEFGEWEIATEEGWVATRRGFGRSAAFEAASMRAVEFLTEEEATRDLGDFRGTLTVSIRGDDTSHTIRLFAGFPREGQTVPSPIAIGPDGDPAFINDPISIVRNPADFLPTGRMEEGVQAAVASMESPHDGLPWAYTDMPTQQGGTALPEPDVVEIFSTIEPGDVEHTGLGEP